MTFCPAGQHPQKKAGFADHVIVGTAALGATLNNVPVLAAVPFAALVASIGLDLANLCTADPPTQPTMNLTDWVALAGPPGLAEFTGAQAKFVQWCQYFLWFQFCECSGSSTPAVTVPSLPSGFPQINPAITGFPVAATPCYPPATANFSASTTVGTVDQLQFPDTLLGFSWTLNNNHGVLGDGNYCAVTFSWMDIHHAHSFTDTTIDVLSQTVWPLAIYLERPAGAVFLQINTQSSAGGSQGVVAGWSGVCEGGIGPGIPSGAAPLADPTLLEQISQILQMVTLIQRQAVPFAYIASTVHAGLTGAGSISIADLLGVQIAITTDSTHLGVEGTSPAELFDRGWITFATSDGAMHSTRLEHAAQLIMPCQAGVYTTLYYDLHPLITVSITELLREP